MVGHYEIHKPVAYWNANLPFDQRTEECPPHLQNIGSKDQMNISLSDSEYEDMPWETIAFHIEKKRLDKFQRRPTQLRAYLKHLYNIKQEHGNTETYLRTKVLQWPNIPTTSAFTSTTTSTSNPLAHPQDIKVILNAYPYGFAPGIVHLVVWTKRPFPDSSRAGTGELSADSAAAIEAWVADNVRRRFGDEHVLWWKNTTALKSVRGLEHFHVLVREPDLGELVELVCGDGQMLAVQALRT